MTKVCIKCKKIKDLNEFPRDSHSKDGTRNDCKICNCASSCARQKKNIKQVLIKNKLWKQNNPEHYKRWLDSYAPIREAKKRIRYSSDEKYRQRIIKNGKKYRNNPKNKTVILATQRKLRRKYQKDPQWRAVMNLRRRMSFVLAGKRKAAHSIQLLGCTRDELRAHLERQFTAGMTWDNYGVKGWHIDHRKPCAVFDLTNPKHQRECFHYTNLQPLWAVDNLSKGDTYKL